jgi:hypothetical protein
MANVIIGIHGLGNKPRKKLLEHWWRLAMIEGLKTNNYHTILPKFELVYWADILYDKPLSESEKDEDSPYLLDEKYVKAPKDFPIESHKTRRKILDFISRQINHIFLNEDFSLNYSILTDVILRKYFKDLDIYYTENYTLKDASICKAKDLINKRLIKVLEKYKNYDIMLISHSMGSIIAFDVLNFEAPQIIVNSFVTMGSPLGIPIIISKIAAEQKQRMNGVNHMNTPPPVAKNWYNFSDILDKVAFNYMLADDFSENDHGIKPVDFLVINNYEINGKRNPHKSFGYLRTPEFSKVLNDFILAEKLTIKQKIIHRITQIIQHVKAQISS